MLDTYTHQIRLGHTFVFALVAAACGGAGEQVVTDPTPAPAREGAPVADRSPPSELDDAERTARGYVNAKLNRQWDALWDMAASVHQDMVVEIGKRLAERDDLTAKAQGFETAEEVRKLSPRAYFVRRRQHLAEQHQQIYKDGVSLSRIEIGPAIMVPFPGKRVSVHPVRAHMSDGSVDLLAATREEGAWKMLEK